MAGRFPFDSTGRSAGSNPLTNPQVRAALGLGPLDDALFLQMQQQEQRREMQLQQMILQERLAQESRMESMLHEQQLKAIGDHLQEYPDLQQHYSRLLLNDPVHRGAEGFRRVEEELLRRRQLLAQQQQQQQQQQKVIHPLQQQLQHPRSPQPSNYSLKPPAVNATTATVAPVSSAKLQKVNQSMLRDIAADPLAGNAVRRGDVDKRRFAKTADGGSPARKLARNDTYDSTDVDSKLSPQKQRKLKKEKKTKKQSRKDSSGERKRKGSTPNAQDLIDFASSPTPTKKKKTGRSAKRLDHLHQLSSPTPSGSSSTPTTPRGTLGDLIDAVRTDVESDEAAKALVGIKEHVDWPDSEEELEKELIVSNGKSDAIELPNFISILPRLPAEPSIEMPTSRRKHKGLLDDDSVEEDTDSKAKDKGSKNGKSGESKRTDIAVNDLPYPIDTWWPSVTSIKRERKALGESTDDDDDEKLEVIGDEKLFCANIDKIKEKLEHDVQPGVLEKIPHCKIHRLLMKKKKNPSAPEFVYCWQVTELYPNDLVVCCSRCGTWRHTACGGHYKPYSVRESVEKPFIPVCDRCHEEEKILEDYPTGSKRLDRQRCEQIRRGLSTSAAMRQASFSKHGGTYKWPLGSVSATHIGGHTRSVHSRHDKAEKQWTDMASKLSRGYAYRPKERVKHRTKELERLLVSVEDAEGQTDRHNMLVFLLQDTLRKAPVGFENNRRNIFDPGDDNNEPNDQIQKENGRSHDSMEAVPDDSENSETGEQDENESSTPDSNDEMIATSSNGANKETQQTVEPLLCIRKGCVRRPRFDSAFCSDACGVSALENDLLRTFFYSSDIHPSSFRH